ncbi:MAG TPA: hypothetical protein VGI99_05940 [Gemmataceae bacterium]|jgi:hypothetical protein
MALLFDPQAYGPAIAALLVPDRLPELGPGSPDPSIRPALAAVRANPSCRSALWLLHDFLDESHTISQDLDTAEGSFWHAIMHRREPDASNSKYWWRRVGPHPVLKRLVAEAPALGYAFTTPFDFVDFCERVRGTGTPEEYLARRVQLLEWRLLFDACFRAE